MNPRITWFSLLCIITAYTWVLGLLDFKYVKLESLGFENGFVSSLPDWKPSGGWENIEITDKFVGLRRNSAKKSFATTTIALPANKLLPSTTLLVRGEVETVNRGEPVAYAEQAGYMAWPLDADKKPLRYLSVMNLTAEFPTHKGERIVGLTPDTKFLQLALVSRETNSEFNLIDTSIEYIVLSKSYQLASAIMYLGWIIIFALASLWIFRRSNFKTTMAIGIIFCAIVVGVLLPESISNAWIVPSYKSLLSTISSKPIAYMYKIGHFLFFFVATAILIYKRNNLEIGLLYILLCMLVIAIASEGLQLHEFSRTTRILDILIDVSGVLSGALIGFILTSTKQKPPIENQITP